MTKKISRAAASFLALGLALGLACASCGAAPAQPAVVGTSDVPLSGVVTYLFDSLDSRPVDTASMRGKPTVIAFVQTLELWSQAQMNFLTAMASHDADKVNYVMVVLATSATRELVELWRQTLKVTFPTALADIDSINGIGPFGALKVPTIVVLDREGRIAWRAEGRVAKSNELRAQLRGL